MSNSEKEYNYFKLSEDGEVLGVGAAEKGTPNETFVIDECIRLGMKIEKITKEEYDGFDGGVIKNF
jgi:hypothetical protein